MSFVISFPFRIQNGQFPAQSNEEQSISESLEFLLHTPKGSLPMLPDYGLNVRKYIFETNDSTLRDAMQYEVGNAIARWETRVIVEAIRITQLDEKITVDIDYTIKKTNTQQVFSTSYTPSNA